MESKPYSQVLWTVELGDEFKPEFDALAEEVQDELLEKTRLLQQFGPRLGRPNVDTLKDSKHANMKELRFNAADGVWRAAFAFDPARKAIQLVAGDKIWRERKTVLQTANSKSRCTFRRAFVTTQREEKEGTWLQTSIISSESYRPADVTKSSAALRN